MADISLRLNEKVKAYLYLQEVEQKVDQIQFNPEVLKLHRQLGSMFYSQRNFLKASFYQNRYIQLRDSIYDLKFTSNAMRAEAEYIEQMHNKVIQDQQQILELKEAAIEKQLIINACTGILAIIFLAAAIIFFRTYRKKRRLNDLLSQRVKERTKELELINTSMIRRMQEKNLLTAKILRGIRSKISSLKGMCFVVSNSTDDHNILNYIRTLEMSVDDLNNYVERLRADADFSREITTIKES